MLKALRTSDHTKVLASTVGEYKSLEAEARARQSGPLYVCPHCYEAVILKRGRIVIPHFAHKPTLSCYFGHPETRAHLAAKQAIYDCLVNSPNVSNVEMEHDFGISVADVFATLNGCQVAIEIQQSGLNVETLRQRTLNYATMNVYVLWAALWMGGAETYKPRAWERWLHAAYFGRVYYWINTEIFLPVHFGKVRQFVEYSNWHDQDGEAQEAGGYWKTLKRDFHWQPGRTLRLTKDFRAMQRSLFCGGDIEIPECKLFADKTNKWWNNSQ